MTDRGRSKAKAARATQDPHKAKSDHIINSPIKDVSPEEDPESLTLPSCQEVTRATPYPTHLSAILGRKAVGD